MSKCIQCDVELTALEAEYYELFCEGCEVANNEEIKLCEYSKSLEDFDAFRRPHVIKDLTPAGSIGYWYYVDSYVRAEARC